MFPQKPKSGSFQCSFLEMNKTVTVKCVHMWSLSALKAWKGVGKRPCTDISESQWEGHGGGDAVKYMETSHWDAMETLILDDAWWYTYFLPKKWISKPHDIIRCNTHLILEKLLAVALPSFSCIIPVGIRFMLPMGIDQGHMRSSGQVSRAYAGRSFDGKKLRVCMGGPAPCTMLAAMRAFRSFMLNIICKMWSACPVFPRLEKFTERGTNMKSNDHSS